MVVTGHRIPAEAVTAWRGAVGSADPADLPSVLVHAQVFGAAMELMADPEFPLPLPGLVHLSNTVLHHRPVAAETALRVTARAVTRRAVSAATGRWCRTVLLRCTSPGRGSGNSGSAISSIAAPNTWACTRTEGRSAGSADPTAPRHAVTASAGMRWPVTTT